MIVILHLQRLTTHSQGFATGSLDDDAWAIRHFATLKNSTLEMAVCQSFSKNFGLYGERIGALHIVASDADNANKAAAALKKISRSEITASPGYPAKIVSTIVQDPELREQWQQDMNSMSGRMRRMRQSLYDGLKKRGTPGKWDHLLTDVSSSLYFSAEDGVVTNKLSPWIDWNVLHVWTLPRAGQ